MNELYNILKLKCEQETDRLAEYEGFPVEKLMPMTLKRSNGSKYKERHTEIRIFEDECRIA